MRHRLRLDCSIDIEGINVSDADFESGNDAALEALEKVWREALAGVIESWNDQLQKGGADVDMVSFEVTASEWDW